MRGVRAVVLGGGIAGLSTGIELARLGADVDVVEGASVPGGLAGGFRDRGYTFDFFSHRLWTRDDEVKALFREWTGRPLVARRKVSRILLDGRFYHYPIDLRDAFAGRSLAMVARALAGYAGARLAASPRGGDFRSHIVSRFGASLFDTFFGPYTEKLFGCPPEQISADVAVSAVPASGIVLQLLRRVWGAADPWDDFLYPEGGFLGIPEGMARALEAAGGRLRLGHRAVGALVRAGRIAAVEVEGANGRIELPADVVISTIPLRALVGMLGSAAPSGAAEDAAALKTRAMIAVYLGVCRSQVTRDHWIYVPDPAIRFNRISETTNYDAGMAPAHRTGLCLEIACDVGDAVWRESDAAQRDRATADLVRLGLLDSPAEIEYAWTHRAAAAYPVFGVGYRDPLARLLAGLGAISNLHLCGRQGAFEYGSVAQGVRWGIDLARLVAGTRRAAA